MIFADVLLHYMAEKVADGCKRFRQVSSYGESKYSWVILSSVLLPRTWRKAWKWLKARAGKAWCGVGSISKQPGDILKFFTLFWISDKFFILF